MGDIINAGADLLGFGPASKQADATENAANMSLQASREATALQKAMYDQTRTDQTPWREAGVNALAQLTQGTGKGGSLIRPFGMSDFQQDPGYGFRMSEGLKALDRSASARGGLLSGAALKGITRYGQDMGSQEYGAAYNRFNQDQSNQYNRLASMAGLGQTANGVNATAGQNYSTNAGNNMMTNGANQGNASIAQGNIRASQYNNLGSAINTGLNYDWNNLTKLWGGGGGNTLNSDEQALAYYMGG